MHGFGNAYVIVAVKGKRKGGGYLIKLRVDGRIIPKLILKIWLNIGLNCGH
jgi:hypothetical protein